MSVDFAGKNVLENLECCICKENYRDPRKITCGHSFCLKCLHQHIIHTVKDSKARTFPCPLCKTDIAPLNRSEGKESWAKVFPVHIMLKNCVKVIEMGSLPPPDYGKRVVDENDIHLCEIHKKTTDVYCLNHKTVVCDRCVWQEHNLGACKIVPVQETETIKDGMIKSLTKRFKSQFSILKSNSATFAQREKLLKKSLDVVCKRINSMEEKLENVFKTYRDEVAKLRNEAFVLFENIKSQGNGKSTYNSMLRNAKSVLSDLKESDDCIWILKTLKILEAQADDMETELDSTFKLGHTYQLEFVENDEMCKLFKTPPTLGVLKASKSPIHSQDVFTATMAESADELDAVGDTSNQKTTLVDRFRFKASRDDESECLLSAVACFGEHVLVADNENGNVKLFTSEGSFVESFNLPDCCGLCVLPQSSELIVSQPDEQIISILDIQKPRSTSKRPSSAASRPPSASKGKCMKLKRVTRHSKKYSSLCTLSSSTFAAAVCDISNPSVDIMNPQGGILRSISNSFKGNLLFKSPQCITSNGNGLLHIADPALNKIVQLDVRGHDLAASVVKTGTRPSGICLSENDIIVCQIDRNTVRCYESTGENYLFVKKKHRVKRPLAITINDHYLYVTEEYPSKNIIRFAIEKEQC